MQFQNKLLSKVRNGIVWGCLSFLCTDTVPVFAQVQSVTTVQNLDFGMFAQGSQGGTVTVSGSGERNATGSVTLFNFGPLHHPALFDVAAPSGTIISISFGSDVLLTGSNGGSMRLHLETSNPVAPFTSGPSEMNQVQIGGTLTVGNVSASPPGSYSGTFSITFNNE
jgi:hypothetical protein